MGGRRAHPQPALAQEVARPVLEAALPLLAQLRRPQLLLDERRLQVVFKERTSPHLPLHWAFIAF